MPWMIRIALDSANGIYERCLPFRFTVVQDASLETLITAHVLRSGLNLFSSDTLLIKMDRTT